MFLYLAWGIASIVLVLVSVSLYGRITGKSRMTIDWDKGTFEQVTGLQIDDIEAHLDDYVARAQVVDSKGKRHLLGLPIFYAFVFFFLVSCGYNIYGAHAAAWPNVFLFVITAAVFVAGDAAIAIITVGGDRSNASWWEIERSSRPWWHYVVIAVGSFLSLIAVTYATSEIGNKTVVKKETEAISYDLLKRQVDEARRQLKELPPEGRDYTTLEKLAASTKEAADREAKRGGCQAKCEALLREHKAYLDRAGIARTRQTLIGDIEEAQRKLSGAASTGRVTSTGFGDKVEGVLAPVLSVFGMTISAESSERHVHTFIGVSVIVIYAILGLLTGDALTARINREFQRRAERADRQLTGTLGKPPKYTVERTKAPTAPPDAGKLLLPADEIRITHLEADTLLRNMSNDATVHEIHSLLRQDVDKPFLVPLEGARLTFDDLARAHMIERLKSDPNAKAPTATAFREAFAKIVMARSDVKLGSGAILGWQIASRVAAVADTEAGQDGGETAAG